MCYSRSPLCLSCTTTFSICHSPSQEKHAGIFPIVKTKHHTPRFSLATTVPSLFPLIAKLYKPMSVLTVSSLLTPFCLDSLQLTIAPTAPLTRHADHIDTCYCSPLRVSAVGSVPSTPGGPSLCLGAQPSLVPNVTLFWVASFLTGHSLMVPPPISCS